MSDPRVIQPRYSRLRRLSPPAHVNRSIRAWKTRTTIRINGNDRVWVNGRKVTAKRSDGALVFKAGKTIYTIQGDRRLKNEDYWSEAGAGTKGPILAK